MSNFINSQHNYIRLLDGSGNAITSTGGVLNVGDSTAQTSLSVLEVNTGNIDTSTSSILVDTGNILLDTTSIAGSSTSIDGKITTCDTGNVGVVSSPTFGSHANAWNADSVTASSQSNSIDCQYCSNISIFGTTTGMDQIHVLYSQDNSNFYKSVNNIYPVGGDFSADLIGVGARYLKLEMSSGASPQTITTTIAGKI